MLAIDIQPGAPTPPAFAKQLRYIDGWGDVLEVHDLTEMFDRAARAVDPAHALAALDRWAKSHYPPDAASFEQLVFWPAEGKWVVTTRHDRVQERLALAERKSPEEAARARRFARMMQGRDRL
ncbi:MAG: hypothetical protein WCY02_01790 [Parvibaculum sp.]